MSTEWDCFYAQCRAGNHRDIKPWGWMLDAGWYRSNLPGVLWRGWQVDRLSGNPPVPGSGRKLALRVTHDLLFLRAGNWLTKQASSTITLYNERDRPACLQIVSPKHPPTGPISGPRDSIPASWYVPHAEWAKSNEQSAGNHVTSLIFVLRALQYNASIQCIVRGAQAKRWKGSSTPGSYCQPVPALNDDRGGTQPAAGHWWGLMGN